MNKAIITKKGSLLERAAEVYDFSARLNARAIPESDLQAPPVLKPVEPAPIAEAPKPSETINAVAVPMEVPAAPVARPAPVPPAALPVPGRQAKIDRELLAENQLLIPGAAIGVLAEEFRLAKRHLLLTARQLNKQEPDKARTILVCSAKPGDGKTYCAINLAISMAAERDTRVLLVDADFAKPSILSTLGLPGGRGLMDALADPTIRAEECVIATDVPGLFVLPAGSTSNSDSEFLASGRTSEVLDRLTQGAPNRIVIFDSPPALAASPAAELAKHVGQALVVARADLTGQSALEDALTLLSACPDIKLLLNAAHFSPSGRRFGTYYGYGE